MTALADGSAPILVFLLALAAAGGLLSAMLLPNPAGRSALRDRLARATGATIAAAGRARPGEGRRRQTIERALSDMAAQERARQRAKTTLKMRMAQANVGWTMPDFYLRAFLTGLATGGALWLLAGSGPLLGLPLGGAIGYALVRLHVRSLAARRMRRFLAEFPNAIDVVSRGVKTGLPVGDCLRAVAVDGQEPVKGEFQRIADDLALGLPMPTALTRFTERVPLLEANFFAVVLAVQSKVGGNLSEALGNLSGVLRQRRMLKEKIKAFSAEATTSASIIAAMPVVVGGILSLTSPDYIGLMLTEPLGNIVLGVSVVWMAIGVLVMRGLIQFDH